MQTIRSMKEVKNKRKKKTYRQATRRKHIETQ